MHALDVPAVPVAGYRAFVTALPSHHPRRRAHEWIRPESLSWTVGFNSFTRTYIYPYWLTSDMYVNSTRGRNHIVGFNNKTNISRPIHAAWINVKIFSQELCRQCSSGVLGIMSQRNDASLLPIAILGKLISLIFKSLGTDGPTKTDEFSEKFQTAFDPPLIFGKSYCGFRDKIATKVHMFLMAGLL